MSKIFKIIDVACLLIALFFVSTLYKDIRNLKAENKRLRVELAHAAIHVPMKVETIRDTIKVPVVRVVEVDKSSYSKELADKKLLKNIGVKANQVVTQQRTESITADTVKLLRHNDNLKTFCYKDRWAEFRLSLCDSTLQYSVRDSITTVVFREYKHRFLWWRWGTKGYNVKVVNFNPNNTLLYNQYIKVE